MLNGDTSSSQPEAAGSGRGRVRNGLGGEASPYLRAHADQDIDWLPWSEHAFERAARENKPILVSIGYLACYWCHVMAEESFCDPVIARRLNLDFVAIKVDREERPDVDRSVLDAMARLGARTGWPVTAFMTPQGEVFAGGSYYPPEPRHGLPGFADVLADAAELFRRGAGIRDAVPAVRAAALPSSLPSNDAVGDIASYADRLANRLLEAVDPVYGGFGQTGPRFPQAAAHQLLWRRFVVSGIPAFGEAVTRSLSHICGSALYDGVGGGFHRYCADEFWTVPHFEKMLSDNAQLVELLTWVWRETRAAPLRACIEGTLTWAIGEMLVPGVGFAASLAAHDGDGLRETAESGRFYRWDRQQIDAALGPDAAFFLAFHEICPLDDHPSGALQRTDREPADEAEHARLASCLHRLRAVRKTRRRPLRDDKVMADWNGLMIVALVEAGSALDRRDWLAMARQVFDTLTDRLNRGSVLHHCITDGVLGPEGLLDDYAAMSRAALRLFEAFGKQRYLDLAVAWVGTLDAAFWDWKHGGYVMSAAAPWQPTAVVRTITETALPSGNGLMIGVLARLHELTADGRHRDRAERLVATFRADMVRHGIAAATAVNNTLTLGQFVRIAVMGRPDRPVTRDLLRVALDYALPDRMVLGPGSGSSVADDFTPQAQVCIGTTCLLPMTSADALRRLTVPGGLSRLDGSLREPSS